jgi:hypothetical protein
MESVLNLGWVVVATAMCWLWVRHHPAREDSKLRVQWIALTLVLATMFTLITLYDDMAMAQNPAETSSFQREDFAATRAQSIPHPATNVAQLPTLEQSTEAIYLGAVGDHPAPALRPPALDSAQNRPPPAA